MIIEPGWNRFRTLISLKACEIVTRPSRRHGGFAIPSRHATNRCASLRSCMSGIPCGVLPAGSFMQTVMFSRARRRTRGQTMTEFALVVPVLMVLIMGVLDGALLMFSVGTARYSSAEGSRVAATLGNVANTDSQVVATVRNIVSGTQLFTVNEVDIYKLNQDGNGNLTQDVAKTNKYALDGTPLNATPWPATSRNVGNGTSDFIGITVNYTYTWKAGFFAPLGPLRTTAISYVRIEPQSY